MPDYGVGRTGNSLRDALNQLYPLTNLGGISTGYPPQTGQPPRVAITAQGVPPQAQPVIPQVPPVPGPTGGLAPAVPGVPPNPEPVQAQLMQRLGMNQGPPNYAAQLGLIR